MIRIMFSHLQIWSLLFVQRGVLFDALPTERALAVVAEQPLVDAQLVEDVGAAVDLPQLEWGVARGGFWLHVVLLEADGTCLRGEVGGEFCGRQQRGQIVQLRVGDNRGRMVDEGVRSTSEHQEDQERPIKPSTREPKIAIWE